MSPSSLSFNSQKNPTYTPRGSGPSDWPSPSSPGSSCIFFPSSSFLSSVYHPHTHTHTYTHTHTHSSFHPLRGGLHVLLCISKFFRGLFIHQIKEGYGIALKPQYCRLCLVMNSSTQFIGLGLPRQGYCV
jgi:hypothetical protein